MTQLSPHFSLAELTRTDTGYENECPIALAGNLCRLAETLEGIRELLDCPLHINSGYRSYFVNRAVNGVKNSAHLNARAADFVPVGMPIAEAFERIRKSGVVFDQLILEPSWIHVGISCRMEKPRHECLTAHQGTEGMVYAHV
jgi:putative chitinase